MSAPAADDVLVDEALAGLTRREARAEVDARAELERLGWGVTLPRTRTPGGTWRAVARRVLSVEPGGSSVRVKSAEIQLECETPLVYAELLREARARWAT